MAVTDTYAQAAFKKLFGLAHTEEKTYPLGNESDPTGFSLTPRDVYGESIGATAGASSTIIDCTGTPGTGTGRLTLTVNPSDTGGTGTAYYITVPAGHDLIGETNPYDGTTIAQGNRVRSIIPKKYGDSWRPKVYDNAGTPAEIPPLDQSNWWLDEKAGVVHFYGTPAQTPTTLECYVYVGPTFSALASLAGMTWPSSVSAGDVLYASGTNAFAALSGPSGANEVLRSTGANTFAWGSLQAADLPSHDHSDGSNGGSALAPATVDTTGNVTVGGTLGVTGGDTTTLDLYADYMSGDQLGLHNDDGAEVVLQMFGHATQTADLIQVYDVAAGNKVLALGEAGGMDIEVPSGTEDVPLVVKGNAPSVQHLQQWYNNHPSSGSMVAYMTTTGALYVPNINIGYGTGQTLTLSGAPSASSSVYFPDVEFADATVLGKGTAPITPTPSNPQIAKLNTTVTSATSTAWAYLTGYAPEGMYWVTTYIDVGTADAGASGTRIEFTNDGGTTIVGTCSVNATVTTEPGQLGFSVFLAGGDGTEDIQWRPQNVTGTVSMTVRTRIVVIGE